MKVFYILAFLVVSFLQVSCSTEETKTSETNKKQSSDSISVSKNVANTAKKHKKSKKSKNTKEKFIDYEEQFKLENYLVKKISIKDFELIKGNCAVFIDPSSKQIDKLKKEIGEENFYIVADDNIWYNYQANEFLDSNHIKTIHPKKRFLKFVTKSKKEIYFDTRANNADWLTILFRTDSLPKIINPTGIEEEYNLYFGK